MPVMTNEFVIISGSSYENTDLDYCMVDTATAAQRGGTAIPRWHGI